MLTQINKMCQELLHLERGHVLKGDVQGFVGWGKKRVNFPVYQGRQKRWGWWLSCLFFLSWKQQACRHWYSLCLPEDLLVVLQAASCESSSFNWKGGDSESLTKVYFSQISINYVIKKRFRKPDWKLSALYWITSLLFSCDIVISLGH